MSAKSKRIGSNLKKVDRHVIRRREYDALPEVTEATLARAQYRVAGRLKPHPRGPQKAPKKVPLSIRLSSEVVNHFRSKGTGWQTRIDDALKRIVASEK